MQTVIETLTSIFGKSAALIRDPHKLGDYPCIQAWLELANDGSMPVMCGGEVIAAFKPYEDRQGVIFLVRDADGRRHWQSDRGWREAEERGEKLPDGFVYTYGIHDGCPHVGLRLVFSI